MRIAGREVERVDEAAERIEFLGVRALDPGADASLERRLLVELPLEMQRGKQPSIAIFRGSGFSDLAGLPMLGFDAQAARASDFAAGGSWIAGKPRWLSWWRLEVQRFDA